MKIGAVTLKYAVRSLMRHRRRTLISMIGVGVGCAMTLVSMSFMHGGARMQIQAIAESGAGHLRLVHHQWLNTREDTLRLDNWRKALDTVLGLPGVKTYGVRAYANGLLAFGTRSAGAKISAVLPEQEIAFNRIVQRGKLEGRYLKEDDRGMVVIGKTLSRRLNVTLGDDLYATMSGADDIHSAMLRIIGILDTGSRDLDIALCHVVLADLEDITGIEGAGEISILLRDENDLHVAKTQLEADMPEDNAVVTWREVNPMLAANVDGDKAFMNLLTGIIVLVVALGITSAQLTAVLERRKEFAMLSALGMKSRQIITLVIIEAMVIGLGGALVALAAGGSCAWYLAKYGVDFAAMMDDDLGFGDVLFDPIMYGDFGLWLVSYALSISLATTIIATLYPAWKSAQIMPADALRTG